MDGANSLRQQAADGLGSLQETLKGKGDTGSSTAEAVRNKAAELVGAGKDQVEPSVADKVCAWSCSKPRRLSLQSLCVVVKCRRELGPDMGCEGQAKSTLKSVKETVLPTAHAGTLTAEEQRQQAREHLHKASDDTAKAGQHAASAAQTVGHDLRSAADQAGQAASHMGRRFVTRRAV